MFKPSARSVEISCTNCASEHILCTNNTYTVRGGLVKNLFSHRLFRRESRYLPTAKNDTIASVSERFFPTFHHTYNYDNYIILLLLSRGART